MPVDERCRLAAEGAGEVLVGADRLGAAQDVERPAAARQVAAGPGEEAEEVVEAACGRCKSIAAADMPLPHHAGPVARFLLAFGEAGGAAAHRADPPRQRTPPRNMTREPESSAPLTVPLLGPNRLGRTERTEESKSHGYS